MDNVGNGDKGMAYYEAKTDIPLDDKGINEQRAMEHIQCVLTEALAHPAKVEGLVFGIVVEEDAKVTAPNGEKAASFLALVGSAQWQAILMMTMTGKLQELQGAGGLEGV